MKLAAANGGGPGAQQHTTATSPTSRLRCVSVFTSTPGCRVKCGTLGRSQRQAAVDIDFCRIDLSHDILVGGIDG